MILRILIAVKIALILIIPTIGQTLPSLENAIQAYENNDYENAVQFFELTIAGGISNGEIFYNLGNAYYQQGDIANALLNYRRALQFLPRDLDLNIQIARTRSLRTELPTETTHPLIILEQATENLLTIPELGIVALISWIVFWVLILLHRFRRSWRNTLRFIIGIWFVGTVSLVVLLGTRLYVYSNMPPAIVITDSAPIYSGPSVSYFRQYDLFTASEIYIVREDGEWQQFITSDNRQGWIQPDAIAIIPLK